MPTPEDIKFKKAERMTQNSDGGGRMSANVVVDGAINAVVPPLSDLSWAGGQTVFAKVFINIDTADTETYYGGHAIISSPAADPRVSTVIFKTSDAADTVKEAREIVESYVVQGARFPGWLWGDQRAGSRQIVMFAIKGSPAPKIGDVLYLVNNAGTPSEEYQYVRVIKVTVSRDEFSSTAQSSEYGATAMSFKRDIFKCDISDPLDFTFKGEEISKNDSIATNVFNSTYFAAVKFYGVMRPTAVINQNDISASVDSVFRHLVPSSQSEAQVSNLPLGEAGPVVESGAPHTVTQANYALANGKQFYFGMGIKPGSLSFVISGHTYTDDLNGVLYEDTTQRGVVDYESGALTFLNVPTLTATATATAIIGTSVSVVTATRITPITLANQGYNYGVIMRPYPHVGTVMVDYRSQGAWYRLRDDGQGYLVSDIEGTGIGRIDYATGMASITCAALPDIDSAVIWYWGSPQEITDISANITINIAEVKKQLAVYPVEPGSLTITWPTGSGTATAQDNGQGVLTGAATGSIDYAHGILIFRPSVVPLPGSEYEINHDKHDLIMGLASSNYGAGVLTITLPQQPVKPGSVGVYVAVTFDGGITHNYLVRDNGNGGVSASGGAGTVTGSSLVAGIPAKLPQKVATVPGLSGTIDYVTGIMQLSIGSLKGSLSVTDYNLNVIQ